MSKTHWLKNPNKNYLGHWDLPQGNDLVLVIEKAGWEDVKDPTNGRVENKRVVHFQDNYKPLICNETNAKSIFASTGIRYLEDSKGSLISCYEGVVRDRKLGVDVPCVRIRNNKVAPQKTVADYPDIQEKFENCESLGDLKELFFSLEGWQKQLFNNLKDEIKAKLEGAS